MLNAQFSIAPDIKGAVGLNTERRELSIEHFPLLATQVVCNQCHPLANSIDRFLTASKFPDRAIRILNSPIHFFMEAITKRYSDQIIIMLIGIILILLIILFTNMNVARINRQMQQTVEQSA